MLWFELLEHRLKFLLAAQIPERLTSMSIFICEKVDALCHFTNDGGRFGSFPLTNSMSHPIVDEVLLGMEPVTNVVQGFVAFCFT